jgi:hypothetical protein
MYQIKTPTRRTATTLLLSAAIALPVSSGLAFAEGENLSKRQITKTFSTVADAKSVDLDDSAYGDILTKYISVSDTGITGFDYAAVSEADSEKLDGYIDTLEAVDPTKLTREQQIAYWSNMYNAVTLDVMIDYPNEDSIKDVELEDLPQEKKGFFGSLKSALSGGPWDTYLITVNGVNLTLNNIEHEILRKMDEPRIHYSINCASYSCPNLLAEPWSADSLDVDLTAAATAYVNHPRGVRINDDGGIVVSKIYDWFQEDFGDTEAGVIAHLKPYAKGELATALESATAIADFEYDWSLNSPSKVAEIEGTGTSS